MTLPNGDRAVVDLEKLRNYCLSDHHPRGRHKARVFAAALGLTAGEAQELRDALLQAAIAEDAQPGFIDPYGRRYVVDFTMTRHGRAAEIRSHWIIRSAEGYPRLTSCHVR